MLVKVKNLSNPCFSWRGINILNADKKNPLLFSLIKSIPCAEIAQMAKIKPRGELRLSFWFKCKESAMMTMVSLSWEQRTCLGLSIQLFVEDFKEEFTYLFLNFKQGKVVK